MSGGSMPHCPGDAAILGAMRELRMTQSRRPESFAATVMQSIDKQANAKGQSCMAALVQCPHSELALLAQRVADGEANAQESKLWDVTSGTDSEHNHMSMALEQITRVYLDPERERISTWHEVIENNLRVDLPSITRGRNVAIPVWMVALPVILITLILGILSLQGDISALVSVTVLALNAFLLLILAGLAIGGVRMLVQDGEQDRSGQITRMFTRKIPFSAGATVLMVGIFIPVLLWLTVG